MATTIRELFESDIISKCFKYDLSDINTSRSSKYSKKIVNMKCTRCNESYDYEIRCLKSNSILRCSCKSLYKNFELNYKNTDININETDSILDISNILINKFSNNDGYLTFKCCNTILLNPVNNICKIKDLSCQFCDGYKNVYKLFDRNRIILYTLVNNEILKLQDNLIEAKKNLFLSCTTFYFLYKDIDINVQEHLNKLEIDYDFEGAELLENGYISFKNISIIEYLNFINSDHVLKDLDTYIRDDLLVINEIENNIQKLKNFKKHFNFEIKKDVSIICNKLFKDINEFNIDKYMK